MDIAIGHRIKFENPENSTKSIIYDIPGPGQVFALNLMIFVVFLLFLAQRTSASVLVWRVHTLSVLVHTPEHVSGLIGNVYDSFIALVSPKNKNYCQNIKKHPNP